MISSARTRMDCGIASPRDRRSRSSFFVITPSTYLGEHFPVNGEKLSESKHLLHPSSTSRYPLLFMHWRYAGRASLCLTVTSANPENRGFLTSTCCDHAEHSHRMSTTCVRRASVNAAQRESLTHELDELVLIAARATRRSTMLAGFWNLGSHVRLQARERASPARHSSS
jgi:hypothetical protein